MFYTLYQITNKLNGKHYIGKTCQGFKRRWSRHRWESARNGKCRIHQAIKKYGVENFDAKPILIGPNVEWINEMEMRTIKLYDSFNNGYNDTKGGDGGHGSKARLGKTHTAEARAKISAARLGKPSHRLGVKLSEETKQKIRIANIGKKMSLEHKAKISAGLLASKNRQSLVGRKASDETKAKMSSTHKLRWARLREVNQ